jgi:hypothetical protein
MIENRSRLGPRSGLTISGIAEAMETNKDKARSSAYHSLVES